MSYVVTVKSTMEISQNFAVFSEYMNFNNKKNHLRLFFVHPSLVYLFLMTSVKKGEKLVKLTWAKKSKATVVKIPTKYSLDGHV